MLAICLHCKIEKPLTEFYQRPNRVKPNSVCRACNAQYTKNYHRKNSKRLNSARAARVEIRRQEYREIIAKAKNVPCMDCKQSFPPCAMDFDHRDPKEKKFTIGDVCSKGKTINLLLREIEKCDIVCSNCHRIRTFLSRCSGTDITTI